MNRFSTLALLAVAGWGLPCLAAAQTTAAPAPLRLVTAEERDKIAVEQAAVRGGGRGGLVGGVETRVTPGKPYSAEAVTESLQVLGDGNRISRKSATRVFRDNDGRTRREMIGQDGQPTSIVISDPVARTSFTLNPRTKVATQGPVLSIAPTAPTRVPPTGRGGGTEGGIRGRAAAITAAVQDARGDEQRRATEQARGARIEQAETSRTAAGQAKQVTELAASGGGRTTKEDLGEQMVEGVRATGTRNTTVIPAGSSIGNLNEIKIVSEQWFSPELEVLVLTRHSDPRVGETIYRLTNIVRALPDPNLFVPPADYTIRPQSVRSPR